MKFNMKLFLPFAAMTLAQASEDAALKGSVQQSADPTDAVEETRELQVGIQGKKKATKTKKKVRTPPKGHGCAATYCQKLFDDANSYYYKGGYDYTYNEYSEYSTQSHKYEYKFTRENCKWDPTPASYYYYRNRNLASEEDRELYELPSQCYEFNNCYELAACECFWTYEAKCQTKTGYPDIAYGESPLDLFQKVYDANDDKYFRGNKAPLFEKCFPEEIYNCGCNPEINDSNVPADYETCS